MQLYTGLVWAVSISDKIVRTLHPWYVDTLIKCRGEEIEEDRRDRKDRRPRNGPYSDLISTKEPKRLNAS